MKRAWKHLCFYIGKSLLECGLFIMPFEALASIGYNTEFLKKSATATDCPIPGGPK